MTRETAPASNVEYFFLHLFFQDFFLCLVPNWGLGSASLSPTRALSCSLRSRVFALNVHVQELRKYHVRRFPRITKIIPPQPTKTEWMFFDHVIFEFPVPITHKIVSIVKLPADTIHCENFYPLSDIFCFLSFFLLDSNQRVCTKKTYPALDKAKHLQWISQWHDSIIPVASISFKQSHCLS